MSEVDLKQYINEVSSILEDLFDQYFPENCDDLTVRAARYSLRAGGKRIRPVLMMAVGDSLGMDRTTLLPFACALEMIHTYSLIHDDLPCMDNDDLRRGLPTCHIRYSEATALLAGDALLNTAYEILLEQCILGGKPSALAGQYIAQNAGIAGMIGGQSLDIHNDVSTVDEDLLIKLHGKKTGALIASAVMTPYYLNELLHSNESLCIALGDFARHLGLSFQIKDDLLDVQSTSDTLGKTIGKDQASGKATFVTLLGELEAQNRLDKEYNDLLTAVDKIAIQGYNVALLLSIVDYLQNRNK